MQQVFARPTHWLTLLVVGIWLLWLWAVLAQRGLIGLATSLSDFLAAAGFYYLAQGFPQAVQQVLRGLGSGLVVLGLGDLVLSYQVWTRAAALGPLSEGLFLSGALLLGIYGFALPRAIHGLGLYRPRETIWSLLLPPLLGLLATIVIGWTQDWSNFFAPLYTLITFSLLFLFAMQVALMYRSRLRRSLQRVMWALALVSLARLLSVAAGAEPGASIITAFSFLWVAGMSLIAFVASD
jgi:hypothetical protein